MNSYLGSLIERTFSPLSTLRPRAFSIFEPQSQAFLWSQEQGGIELIQQMPVSEPGESVPLWTKTELPGKITAQNSTRPQVEHILRSDEQREDSKLTSPKEQLITRKVIQDPIVNTQEDSDRNHEKESLTGGRETPRVAPAEMGLPLAMERNSSRKEALREAVQSPEVRLVVNTLPKDEDAQGRSANRVYHDIDPRDVTFPHATIEDQPIASRRPSEPPSLQAGSNVTRVPQIIMPAHSSKSSREPVPAPTIHVTIGRVEIRASLPATKPRLHTAPKLGMNLEDYLRRRNGESA